MTTSTQALKNIRVLDLSRVLAGPYCTMMLADYGAEVIKVEEPTKGDGTRGWGPPWQNSQSAYYQSVNRNKQSLTLNLKTAEGKTILRQLLSQADILVENFKRGTMAKLGFDYASLQSEHPALIYCSITGYGQTGPYKDRAGYDFAIQAEGGIMSITGPAQEDPYKVGVAVVDVTAGLYACNAILAALHHRQQTGQGQYIDVALLDAQLGWLVNVAQNYLVSEQAPTRHGNAHPNIVPYQTFATTDGHIALAVGSDSQFKKLSEWLQRPEWAEVFPTNTQRVNNRLTLIPQIQAVIHTLSTETCLKNCRERGIPCAPINDIPTILNDPHVQERDMVQTISHPDIGEVRQIGPVAKLSTTPATIRTAPPTLGQHTISVLQALGYTQEQITKLKEKKFI